MPGSHVAFIHAILDFSVTYETSQHHRHRVRRLLLPRQYRGMFFLDPVTQLTSCQGLRRPHQCPAAHTSKSLIGRSRPASRLFRDQFLQFLINYIGAENISETNDDVLDHPNSFHNRCPLQQKELEFAVYPSDNMPDVFSIGVPSGNAWC